jgi:Rad3-related DNA helicase
MKSEILNHFDRRNGRKPRAEQAQALLEIEAGWDSHDIIVVNVPTGGGKTLISDCIAQWQAASGKRCHLVVPDNMLLAQAEVECAKEAAVMKAQRFYECTWKGLDDKPVKGTRATCPYKSCKKKFTDGCPYMRALKKWQKSNVRISNRWMPGAHKMIDKCDTLIIDEGHNYADFLASLCAKRIWHREMAFPLDAQTYIQIKNWCQHALEQLDHVDKGHPKMSLKIELQILWQELTADVGKYTVMSTYADYRGHPEPCIELRPIEVRDALPLAVNRKTTKKMVFLSATYSIQDLKDLGLDRNRILFVTVGSPIPVDRRPIYVKPILSNRVVDGYKDLNEVLEVLEVLARRFPNNKGIAHMTYSMSKEMRKRKIPETLKARLIFHDSTDKLSKLQEFYKSENAIFIGCGVSEGLDLKDDLARFGVVCKIPWGSLADPVTARKAEGDPDWYTWKAATSVMQACGRVCRSATDYGEMYILDSSYKRIPEKHWLGWFKEALHLL